MSVHSNLLAVGGTAASGTANVYRSPANTTTIVKSLFIYNDATGSRTFYLDMPLGPDVTWAAAFYEIASKKNVVVELWQVIPALWPLGIGCTTSGQWFYWVSGTQLTGVPDHPPQSGPLISTLPA